MQNRYQVKIDESVLPELYSFDQMINAGLLDDYDDNIMVRLNGDTEWITARRYPFNSTEKLAHEQTEYKITNKIIHPPKSEQINYEKSHCNMNNMYQNFQQMEKPSIIYKWNWGAFCFSWAWGVFNGIYWPIVIIPLNFVPYIGLVISICICLFLGNKGNELAWKASRQKEISVVYFEKVQARWNKAGIIVFAIIMIVSLLSVTLIFIR